LHSLPPRVSSKRQKITSDCTGDAVAITIATAAVAATAAPAAASQRLSTLESIHFTRVSSLNCRLVVLSVERAENGGKRQRRNKRTRDLAVDGGSEARMMTFTAFLTSAAKMESSSELTSARSPPPAKALFSFLVNALIDKAALRAAIRR